MGNALEFISGIVDFELFRETLENRLQTQERKSNAGRPPIDPVLMFKVMFLQRLYGLSDVQTEYQIKDRTSFRKFLGIFAVEAVPDARTLWKYREALTRAGAYERLFKDFYGHLVSLGLIVNEGKMIDASYVVAPRQRNTREDNKKIKEGHGGEQWSDKPHKKSHKDIDVKWTKKRSSVEHVFGFIERFMRGLVFRGVGMIRAKACVKMTNLTYNIARLTQIYRYHPEWISMSE